MLSLRNLSPKVGVFTLSWLLLAVFWQSLVHVGGIFGDMWDMLLGYQHLGDMGIAGLWRELMTQFAQVHVLAVPKLFFWINFDFFDGSGSVLKFFSFIFCLLNFLLLYALVADNLSIKAKSGGLFVAGLLIFFNGFQTLVIDWDFLLQHYLAVFFSLFAFLVYERNRNVPLVFLLVMLAGFSCGSGLATLVSAGFLLLVRREKMPIILTYTAFALALLWLVAPSSLDVPPEMALLPQNSFFWSAPSLLLQYLSYPFSAWGDFRWLGFLIVLLCFQSFYQCVRLKKSTTVDFLMCYFFLIACFVVMGRYRFFTLDQDLSRFYVYIAPLWFLILVKIAGYKMPVFLSVALGLCCTLVVGGFAAIAVAADHAGRMAMAQVVALNGNFGHLAALRLNAMGGNPLQQQSEYLQTHGMDIYHNTIASVSAIPLAGFNCTLTLNKQAVVTKGTFVDYYFSIADAHEHTLTGWYATEKNGDVRYYGTAVAAVNRMKGWQLHLNQISWHDWPLLVPLSWLPAKDVLLYTHLPRSVQLNQFEWWAITANNERCSVVIESDVRP